MSQVDNSGFRLMKAHSAYGVERAVLFVFPVPMIQSRLSKVE